MSFVKMKNNRYNVTIANTVTRAMKHLPVVLPNKDRTVPIISYKYTTLVDLDNLG